MQRECGAIEFHFFAPDKASTADDTAARPPLLHSDLWAAREVAGVVDYKITR